MPTSKLKKIHDALIEKKFQSILIPKWDEFRAEFIESCDDYLAWSTGFTGSYGVAFISLERSVLFVDGRYTIQAKQEAKSFEIVDIKSMASWLREHAQGQVVFDPWLFTEKEIQTYQTEKSDFFPLTGFFDTIWPVAKRKTRKMPQVAYYPLSGQSSFDKRIEIIKSISPHDYILLSNPESISWLLNIRDLARDFTPVVNGYALVNREGLVELFMDGSYEDLFDGVLVLEKKLLIARLLELKDAFVIVSKKAPYMISKALKNSVIQDDPLDIKRACKNEVELQYMRLTHRRDGAALSEFLCWLSTTQEKVTEISVGSLLLQFRQLQRHFLNPSFPTIAGAREHSAIIHYHPTKKTDYTVNEGDVLLIDSGGQYWGGTTDVTRTVIKGSKKADEYFKQVYTAVLRGVIALSSCVFKKGTSGHQLDALARTFLWEMGLDYAHGTGHGVGAFLNVHEGPQSISSYPNHTPLEKGMVVSIEPGCYLEGKFGIRLENLACVVEVEDQPDFLTFETITYAPFCADLVCIELLTDKEKAWLYKYHYEIVLQNIYTLISDDCYDFIYEAVEKFS